MRPEIQGLRAVAVGSVLLYHLWPKRLPGGFVGVDVFFVISGFLIGSHLLAELDATGRIRLGRFWARRAKRLLPASLLVLLTVAVATVLVAPLSLRKDFLEQVIGSTFYVQNWVLAAKSLDYSASGDAVSPVQHYWTLSAEEQMYVALPLILALVAVATRLGVGLRSRTTILVLTVLWTASLAYSVAITTSAPDLAYFSTGTRVWEFLSGVLLGRVAIQMGGRIRALLGSLGLLAVVIASVTLSSSSAFPGYIAALPVAGAVLVIAAADAGPVAWASRWRPVTWLGDISYAVYLWHWPMIVLVPYATGEPLSATPKLVIGASTVLISWLSTRWVETPIRTSPRLLGGQRRARVVGAVCLAASLVVAGSAMAGSQASTREQDRLTAAAEATIRDGNLGCLGAAAMDPSVKGCEDLGDILMPDPSVAAKDAGNRAECWATYGDAEPRICAYGPEDAPVRALAIGDSHNNTLLPAYEQLSAQLGWHIDVTGKAGCSWSTRPQFGRTEAIAVECTRWKTAISDHLAANAPYDVIITTSVQTGDPAVPKEGETADEATVAGLSEAWSSQIARGTLVIVIRDNPKARDGIVQCVEREGIAGATKCAYSRQAATGSFDAIRSAAQATPGSVLVDLRDLMCDRRTCFPVIGNVVVYRDRTHMTATFVRTLAPYLIDRVERAWRTALAESPPS